jgi:sugar (pentulose or hexulose) kinase
MAHVLGHRVRLSDRTELTSRGAAIAALRAASLWESWRDEALDCRSSFDPDPGRAEVYQAALERQHRLYASVIGVDPEIGPSLAGAVAG